MNESMFSAIDQIRQDSKDVRDFVKNVFKDRDFKKMSNDKEFIKYLKSIYEGINEAIPQNFHQGRTSDYHTALRGKNRDYSGGTNFKKKNHGHPDVEEDDEDQETNHLSNKQTHIKSDKLKVSEGFDNTEHLSLLNKALRAIPGSKKQKDIIKKLNIVRKSGGMKPLKELSIVEYGQRLDLSFIEDDEARLDGTPKPKDAIDTELDEGRPIPMDTPNELVYLDFKKYAYKNRSMFKRELVKNKDNSGKMFTTLSALWYKWARKDNKEFTHIKDKSKFGRALMIMMVNDDIIFDKKAWKKTNKITNLKEIEETAKRDYKDEYKKFQSSKKSKKYRAELNKYNRDKGTYGNGDGKDASHKGGKIVGFESASKNRGRKEKSRLKKK